MTLQELYERLDKATGPDRELDRWAFVTLGFPNWEIEAARQMVADGKGDEYLPTGDSRRLRADCVAASHIYVEVTARIDAALGLVEQLLPGWGGALQKIVTYDEWYFELIAPDGSSSDSLSKGKDGRTKFAPTAPLAILKALVAVLGEKEKT